MPSKCFWYPINWIWKQGKASIAKASATKATIIAPTPTGDMEEIEKLDCTTVKEIIGVWQTLIGCQKAQLHKMTTQLSSFYVFLENSYLPRHTIWLSVWSVL